MTTKERIIEQIEQFDETELLDIERELQSRVVQAKTRRRLEEEFRLLDELAAPMDEGDSVAFEEATRRRPLFGQRRFELKPDDR